MINGKPPGVTLMKFFEVARKVTTTVGNRPKTPETADDK